MKWQLVFSTRIIITQHSSTPSAASKAPHKQVETIVMFTWTAFFPFRFPPLPRWMPSACWEPTAEAAAAVRSARARRERVVWGNENGSAATRAAPALGESGVSAGCASDENCGAGSAASTRGESARCASDRNVSGLGQGPPEERSCRGADTRGQRDRQRVACARQERGVRQRSAAARSCSSLGFG